MQVNHELGCLLVNRYYSFLLKKKITLSLNTKQQQKIIHSIRYLKLNTQAPDTYNFSLDQLLLIIQVSAPVSLFYQKKILPKFHQNSRVRCFVFPLCIYRATILVLTSVCLYTFINVLISLIFLSLLRLSHVRRYYIQFLSPLYFLSQKEVQAGSKI